MRRLRWPLGLLVLILVLGTTLVSCLSHKLPQGAVGPEAEALARRVEKAVDVEAWARTGAVRFRFRNDTQHLWDRQRNLDRVRFLGKDEEVLLDVGKQSGRAYKRGQELTGEARDALVKKAYARFCNDTFWLNPLAKLFDEGVTRSRHLGPDGESLIVHYNSGGVTPGDTYQWLIGEGDLPRAWRLFVQVMKIRGLQLSWEGWTSLPTGAKVSTRHRVGRIVGVEIGELAGAATLAELEADPFGPIVGGAP